MSQKFNSNSGYGSLASCDGRIASFVTTKRVADIGSFQVEAKAFWKSWSGSSKRVGRRIKSECFGFRFFGPARKLLEKEHAYSVPNSRRSQTGFFKHGKSDDERVEGADFFSEQELVGKTIYPAMGSDLAGFIRIDPVPLFRTLEWVSELEECMDKSIPSR